MMERMAECIFAVGVEGLHFDLNEDGSKIIQHVPYNEIYAYGLGNPIRFK